MFKLLWKDPSMFMTLTGVETSWHDSPRSPQKTLKEDPNHCLDTGWAVSIDEAIDAS